MNQQQLNLFKNSKVKINKMKCINIVYNKEKQYQEYSNCLDLPIKKSVDQYYTRLIQKQKEKLDFMYQPRSSRIDIRTSKSLRTRNQYMNQMTQSLNIAKIKAVSTPIPSLRLIESQVKNKTTNNFSIKKKQKGTIFSLKSLKDTNLIVNFQRNIPGICQKQKNHSKIKLLQKIKLIKQSTIVISVEFILNQENFWQEENIDQQAVKNWKYLQDFSNIIWLVKRQNTSKKLQKYCIDFGLRLDGVYQIIPNQKQKSITLSLIPIQKEIKINKKNNQNQKDTSNKIIVINSLRVDNIKNVQQQDFFNLLPVTKSLPCIVHFIQIDIQDKQRFNSPLKILSKQVLPSPTKLQKLILKFQKDREMQESQRLNKKQRKINPTAINIMQKMEELRQNYLRYFSQTLRLNGNQKISLENSQISLQYLIGDMLKRNFNILSLYQKQSRKINSKLRNKEQTDQLNQKQFVRSFSNFGRKKLSLQSQISTKDKEDFITSKLTVNQIIYQHPVYLWKK